MTAIDDYFRLVDEVHKHFGYVEDYALFSMQDRRDVFWEISHVPDTKLFQDASSVHFADTADALRIGLVWGEKLEDAALSAQIKRLEATDKLPPFYSYGIYRQRFLKKWVYEAADCTMILVDTHTDGNKFLAIFDNAKRRRYVIDALAVDIAGRMEGGDHV